MDYKKKIDYILKEKFHFDKLHDFQEKVINQSVLNKDIIVLSPTSSGKSLCFQIPALLKPGVTIIINLVVFLMNN